ncbi:uncharacterized protein [Epargyreus clarus]|uniref:uncharacterized protein n=1 Tax=Epargyreus clarus TaxID=520877 RepID=UPI003C2D7691
MKFHTIVCLVVICVIGCRARSEQEDSIICGLASCRCTSEAHPSWVTVNCTVPLAQRLHIRARDLPQATTDLIVTGGEALLLSSNSLSGLGDVRQIFFHRNKEITIKKSTAVALSIVSLYIEIDECEILKIEEKAFSKIKGPLSIEIKNCNTVILEGEALSWLLMINITNVRKLQLSDGSFTLDSTAGNVGEHGPGMSINMNNVEVTEFPARTFGSSAASIVMQAVRIDTIRQGAFSANTYNTVMALNCSIQYIEAEAFAQKSLINSLSLYGCRINELASEAMRSAVAKINITGSRFDVIQRGAINSTVVAVTIVDSEFHQFMENGFVLSSWNQIYMRGNKFDVLPRNAISAPGGTFNDLVFSENEIETVYPGSLGFIGPAYAKYPFNVLYKYNYYGHSCHCNITSWIAKALGVRSAEPFADQSYCTVDYFFAICFNVPEKNVRFETFTKKVCSSEPTIQCEEILSKRAGAVIPKVENPRFPHQKPEHQVEGLNDRDKKVIGIVIVTAVGCVLIVLIISLIRWMRRKGYCLKLKNAIISSNASCGSLCNKMNICGRNTMDNTRSMSQLSVVEYSEHQRLNEPRTQDVQESVPSDSQLNNTGIVNTVDKITQTLPEELTRELLENLKVKLEDPENYMEARELIEHLYDLIKFQDNCNPETEMTNAVENIYELPFHNTAPRIGKNKKQMKSVGTKTPSLENLLPLSPYHRRTALAHEYFEPKDFAVHLYAEIINYDKERKPMLGAIPDVIAEQGMPRGPYLRAVREKMVPSVNNSPTGKMFNRPLPQKPTTMNSGEGSSARLD